MTHPSDHKDLTRWNRAGLERVRYIDGNAVTYLEDIRENLAARFAHWEQVQNGAPLPEAESLKRSRILEQYNWPRKDWAWEIARAFVRSNHILTEHINAFANEGYLNTATQWEYLRRLVDMLDYRPRPPASAATQIALIADPDVDAGTVKKGLQSKYSAPEIGLSLTFETVADIDVDARLNEVRLLGWNHNPEAFDAFAAAFWTAPEKAKVNTGQIAVLVQNGKAGAVVLSNTEDQNLDIDYVDAARLQASTYILGDTRLGVEPDQVYVPAINGTKSLSLSDTSDLSTGDVVAWVKGSLTGFAKITAVDKTGIKFGQIVPAGTDLSGTDMQVFKAGKISRKQFEAHNKWVLDNGTTSNITAIGAKADGSLKGSVTTPTVSDFKGGTAHVVGKKLTGVTGHDLYYMDPTKAEIVADIVPSMPMNVLRIEGGIGKCRTGSWFIAEDSDTNLTAVKAAKIEEKDDHFLLTLVTLPSVLLDVAFLHGPFNHVLAPAGHDRDPNTTNMSRVVLDMPADDVPDILVPGKSLLIESEALSEAVYPAFSAKISEIHTHRSDGSLLEHAELSLTLSGTAHGDFNRGEVIIRANVADFGHGKTQPAMVLGSGDAAEIRQSFILARDLVSFIADPSLEAGVRADLVVQVEDRIYEEVASLANSEPTDAHYEVHMTEAGQLKLLFGDGRHGRRLPTGRNNISVRYRTGTGQEGNNVPAYSFEKTAKPHPRVLSLSQPLTSSGGQNMEDLANIRQNAPDYLRSLGRGVSTSDFEHIARSTPGIWHAKAREVQDQAYRNTVIQMCVVPVDDAPLGDIGTDLQTRLASQSSPNLVFEVERFDPVPLTLSLTVRVDSQAFDPDKVEAEVRAAVFERLKLERRAPSVPIYNSEIYQIVEGIPGVSNSDVEIFPGQSSAIRGESGDAVKNVSRDGQNMIWAVWPGDCQVIYLRSASAIGLTIEEAFI